MKKTHEIAKSIRKSWSISPVTKVHSSPKGKKGYDRGDRQDGKRITRNYSMD